jgi:hypothetical protein
MQAVWWRLGHHARRRSYGVNFRTIWLCLGDETLGHVEQIWRRRSHDTWCAWIWATDGGRWARGESNPLKFDEEACTEWAACLVESGVRTWLVVNNLLSLPLLPSLHHTTALRHSAGIEGMPSQFPVASLVVDGWLEGLEPPTAHRLGL